MTSVFVNVHSFQEVCLHYLCCFIALQSVSQIGLLFSGNIYLLPGQIHSTEVQQRHPVPVVGQCTGLVVHSVFHTLGSHLHDLQFERHSRHAMAGTHVRFQERLLQLILHVQLTTTCFSLVRGSLRCALQLRSCLWTHQRRKPWNCPTWPRVPTRLCPSGKHVLLHMN